MSFSLGEVGGERHRLVSARGACSERGVGPEHVTAPSVHAAGASGKDGNVRYCSLCELTLFIVMVDKDVLLPRKLRHCHRAGESSVPSRAIRSLRAARALSSPSPAARATQSRLAGPREQTGRGCLRGPFLSRPTGPAFLSENLHGTAQAGATSPHLR